MVLPTLGTTFSSSGSRVWWGTPWSQIPRRGWRWFCCWDQRGFKTLTGWLGPRMTRMTRMTVFICFWLNVHRPRDPGSPNLRMVMEPKYFAEVIGYPNHHLRIWRLIPREWQIVVLGWESAGPRNGSCQSWWWQLHPVGRSKIDQSHWVPARWSP